MAVLNLGSINLDYVYRVAHISRPGETLGSASLATFAGGKGNNQSLALARAGAAVVHLGRIGPEGKWLVDLLRRAGADVRFVQTDDGPGGHAIIQVADSGENSIVLFGGANRRIADADVDAALAGMRAGDVFLTQNETSGIAHGLRQARARGLKVCFNPAPFGPEISAYPLDCVDTFVVNETEAAGLAGGEATAPEELLARLARRFPTAELVLTLGARGVMYRSPEESHRVPAEPVNVVDTTAAGDTFIGYFLACRQQGLAVEAALRTANRAAAICVSRAGAEASIPTWAEVASAAR